MTFNQMEVDVWMWNLTALLSSATAILILLVRIFHNRSCLGVSGKTQLLLAIAYACRNADMWLPSYITLNTNYSTLDTTAGLFFTNATLILVYLIFIHFKDTYQYEDDIQATEILMFPSFALMLFFSSPREVVCTFGVCLEAVAMIPQLFMIYTRKQIETVVLYYLLSTGFCKMTLIGKCVYSNYADRYLTETIGASLQMGIFIVAVVIFIFRGITITDGGKPTRLSDMLRGSQEDLTDKVNLANGETIPEKY